MRELYGYILRLDRPKVNSSVKELADEMRIG